MGSSSSCIGCSCDVEEHATTPKSRNQLAVASALAAVTTTENQTLPTKRGMHRPVGNEDSVVQDDCTPQPFAVFGNIPQWVSGRASLRSTADQSLPTLTPKEAGRAVVFDPLLPQHSQESITTWRTDAPRHSQSALTIGHDAQLAMLGFGRATGVDRNSSWSVAPSHHSCLTGASMEASQNDAGELFGVEAVS